MKRYVREVHELSIPYISKSDLILDCGAGELTTLGFLSNYLPEQYHPLVCNIFLSF